MGKKYILQLTPKIRIPLTIEVDKSKPTWKFDVVQGILWFVFFSWMMIVVVLADDSGFIATVSVYALVVMSLTIFTIRKIFFQQKKNLVVPYDLLLLLFTTTLTSSLFITTLDKDITYNIFGGSQFRIFSGISVIALGVMYYLLIVQNSSKENQYLVQLKRFFYSIILAMLFNIIIGNTFNSAISSVLTILLPGFLWLSIKKTNLRMVAFILFLVSIGSLIEQQSSYINFTSIIIFVISGLTVLFLNLKSIKKQVKAIDNDLEKIINKKLSILDAISNHSKIVFLVTSLLLSIVGVIWLSSVDYNIGYVFKNFNANTDWNMTLIAGNGLIGESMSIFSNILSFFGLIVFSTFIIFIIAVLIKMLRATKINEGVYYYVFVMLASITHFILLPSDDITFIVFWLILGLFSIFHLQKIQKVNLKFVEKKKVYNLFTDKEFIKVNKVIPYMLLVLLVVAVVYVVYSLDFLVLNIS